MPVPLPAKPAVLLVDVGNTISFLDEDAVAEVVAERGVTLAPADVRASLGEAKRRYEVLLRESGDHARGWYLFMEVLLEAAGAPAERIEELTRALRASHDALNLWRRVPEEVPGTLSALSGAGVRMGIVSNSEGHVRELLEHVGLARFFEVIIDSGVVGVAKPDPAIFALALEGMGAAAEGALYLGDVPQVDVDGARAAGLDAILVDAFDHYPDYAEAARIRSVGALRRAWL